MTRFQQHYEIVSLAVGVVAVLLAWLQLKKKEPSTPIPSLSQSQVNQSPIVSGSHNQIVIGHAHGESKQADPPKTELLAPHFVYAGAKRKDIFVSPWPRVGVRDPASAEERRNSLSTLVLKFENRIVPGNRKISEALNVIAKLKFHHRNGVTFRDIDYGIWLNSPCNSTDMGIGDTRELVLMCQLENKLVTFEDRRVGNRDFSSEGFSYLEDGDVDGYERGDITLIDQNTQTTLSTKLKLWREGGEFCTSEL